MIVPELTAIITAVKIIITLPSKQKIFTINNYGNITFFVQITTVLQRFITFLVLCAITLNSLELSSVVDVRDRSEGFV